MSPTEQYLLDVHCALQHGRPVPPAPGTHDLRVLRALCDHRRFRAVLAGRPARGRIRHALGRWLHPRRRNTSPRPRDPGFRPRDPGSRPQDIGPRPWPTGGPRLR
ncbi:hypothetical protein [Streptomyces sp. 15-116A]|uniref:hypothetical protein n=1 Tax=Streptomyces sp. 15-116A TaxID=2259035 RepID=UPI0028C4EA6D|nr:hypothetical protein [Streptomyces sp. 15-116A]